MEAREREQRARSERPIAAPAVNLGVQCNRLGSALPQGLGVTGPRQEAAPLPVGALGARGRGDAAAGVTAFTARTRDGGVTWAEWEER